MLHAINSRGLAGLLVLALLLLSGACASHKEDKGPESGDTRVEVPALPEPDLPKPEPPAERNKRLIRLEQALDNWYIATERQEYHRKDSLEQLLLQYTRKNLDAIVSDLKHGSPRHRRVMAAALGFSSSPRVIPALMEALQDPYYEVVEHALLSLYNLTRPEPPARPKPGSKPGIWQTNEPALEREPVAATLVDAERIAGFLEHPQAGVRANAALAIRPLVGPGHTPNSVLLALINATEDRDDRTRVHAIAALGTTGSPEAIPHLVKGLSDEKALVRMRAALALARIGDPQVAPYLIEVLARPEETQEVKRFTARALAALLDVKDERSLAPDVWRRHAEEKGVAM